MSMESDLYDHYTGQDETPPCPSPECDCDDCVWRYMDQADDHESEET